MTTAIQVQPTRCDAPGYWRSRIRQIAAGLAPESEDLVLYSTDSRATAHTTLLRGAHAAGWEVDECRAGAYTRFVVGKLALIYEDAAQWMALCTVTSDGRLATVEDVAVWGDA